MVPVTREPGRDGGDAVSITSAPPARPACHRGSPVRRRAAGAGPARTPWRPRAVGAAGRSATVTSIPAGRQVAREPVEVRRDPNRPAGNRAAKAAKASGSRAARASTAASPGVASPRRAEAGPSPARSPSAAVRRGRHVPRRPGSERRLQPDRQAAAVRVARERGDHRHAGRGGQRRGRRCIRGRRRARAHRGRRSPARGTGQLARRGTGVPPCRGGVALDELEQAGEPGGRGVRAGGEPQSAAAAPRPRALGPRDAMPGRSPPPGAASPVRRTFRNPQRRARRAPDRVDRRVALQSAQAMRMPSDCASTSAVSPASRPAASARSKPPPPTGTSPHAPAR